MALTMRLSARGLLAKCKNRNRIHLEHWEQKFAYGRVMKEIFSPNKTSAKLLVDYARALIFEKEQAQDATDREERLQRFLMLYDLYIKARSYAIINKVSFWFAVMTGTMVLLWPSIAIVSNDFGWEKEFLKSAVVQTTITGLAALTFAVYSHYKKRQLFTESLMRYVLFSDEALPHLNEKVIQEMERIDTGFSFSQAILKQTEGDEEEKARKKD